jgi:hypothetical protein
MAESNAPLKPCAFPEATQAISAASTMTKVNAADRATAANAEVLSSLPANYFSNAL